MEGKDIRGNEMLEKHADWVEEFLPEYAPGSVNKDTVDGILKDEVGKVFKEVLEDAGVYKCTAQGREAFMRFVESVNRI